MSHSSYNFNYSSASASFSIDEAPAAGGGACNSASGCNWKLLGFLTLTIVFLVLLFAFTPWSEQTRDRYAPLESVLLDPGAVWHAQISLTVAGSGGAALSAVQLSRPPPLVSVERNLYADLSVPYNVYVYNSLHLNHGSVVRLVYALSSDVEFYIIKGQANFVAFQNGDSSWMKGYEHVGSAWSLNLTIADDQTYFFVWGNLLVRDTLVGYATYAIDAKVYQTSNFSAASRVRVVSNCSAAAGSCTFNLPFASTDCVVVSVAAGITNQTIPVTIDLHGRLAFYFGLFLGSYLLIALVLLAIWALTHCRSKRHYQTII